MTGKLGPLWTASWLLRSRPRPAPSAPRPPALLVRAPLGRRTLRRWRAAAFELAAVAALRRGNFESARFLLAKEVILRDLPKGETIVGFARVKDRLNGVRSAIPALSVTAEGRRSDGDWLVIRYRARGTCFDPRAPEPATLDLPGVLAARFEEDRVAELRVDYPAGVMSRRTGADGAVGRGRGARA